MDMQALANDVTGLIQSGDLLAIAALMADDVRWGDPQQAVPTCTNKRQVLRWYENGQLSGASADVIESVVVGSNILLGLQVRGNPQAESERAVRWQVLSIADGMIAEIRGYETRSEAESFAKSGTSNW